MRELAIDEMTAVSGGGDVVLTQNDDGSITLDGDWGYGDPSGGGDYGYFVGGDNGAYQVGPDGSVTFWPMP